MHSRLILAALVIAASMPDAHADWTASGAFNYTNRLYGTAGWTTTNVLPVREADVEIYDLDTGDILAAGATDAVTGAFSINVVDGATRNVGVRVLASTDETPVIDLSVVDDLNGNAVYSYHYPSADVAGHAPGDNLDFGTMTMPAAIGNVATTDWSSQVFNAFDMCIHVADWIASVDGMRPSPPLSVGWNPTSGSAGSSYSSGTNRLNLADDDGYDDPNIIHEIGHYVEDEFGRSRNIGGSHSSTDDDQDPRLAWSEGFATFVSGATLNFHGLPLANYYSDRNSFGNSSGFSYSFEDAQSGGSTQERAVSAALYDLVDSPGTNDSETAGVDDDTLSGLDDEIWSVLQEMRLEQTPATNLEDFWDLWRRLDLGSEAAVQVVFAAHHIDFQPDNSEPDDLRTSASTLTGTYVEHSFYRDGAEPGGDEDWYEFSATANTYYRIEVSGTANQVYGRPDPELYLLDTDGKSVLAFNDDPLDTALNVNGGNSANNDMKDTVPGILWRAPASGTYYVYCRHASYDRNLGGRYGTYRIRRTLPGSPTPAITAVAAQRMLPGQSYHALVTGANMATAVAVTTSSADISVTGTRWIAPEAVVATLAVAPGATPGSFSLTVSNPGAGSDIAAGAITIDNAAQPPVLISEVELGIDRAEIKNLGTVSANLTGWQIIGRTTSSLTTGRVFTFPSFSLPPGGTVRVNDTGGSNTATALYDQGGFFDWPWTTTSPGDISLLDAAGRNVDYLRWIRSYTQNQFAPAGSGAAWMQPEPGLPDSGLTLSRHEGTARPRTSLALSGASSTMPAGASGRDNAVDPYEDNDEIRRAPLISTPANLPGLAISTRSTGPADEDWFGIPIVAGEALGFCATFTHAAGDLQMELYPPGEETAPLFTADSATDDEFIVLDPTATVTWGSGIYRLRIYGQAGATNGYSLTIDPLLAHLENWRTFHFGAGSPPGSGNFEDFDFDGIFNIWEYALGLHPKQPDVAGLPQLITGAPLDPLVYSYTRPLANTDLTCVVQFSTDLVTWTTYPDELVSVSGYVETRQAVFPAFTPPNFFLRLHLSW